MVIITCCFCYCPVKLKENYLQMEEISNEHVKIKKFLKLITYI